MVTEDVEPPEIVVEGEGKEGEGPNGLRVDIFDPMLHLVNTKRFDLKIRVLKNVGSVIELEGDVKGVSVSHKGHSHHQADSDEVLIP
jgi:hypothetical protein